MGWGGAAAQGARRGRHLHQRWEWSALQQSSTARGSKALASANRPPRVQVGKHLRVRGRGRAQRGSARVAEGSQPGRVHVPHRSTNFPCVLPSKPSTTTISTPEPAHAPFPTPPHPLAPTCTAGSDVSMYDRGYSLANLYSWTACCSALADHSGLSSFSSSEAAARAAGVQGEAGRQLGSPAAAGSRGAARSRGSAPTRAPESLH